MPGLPGGSLARPLYDLAVIDPVLGLAEGVCRRGVGRRTTAVITTNS